MSRFSRLTKPESRERQELRLALAPPEALKACTETVQELGWNVRTSAADGRRLTVLEDFTKLSCGNSPIRLEIELEPEDRGRRSVVNVEGVVPGVGGLSSNHLRERMRVFAVVLGRQAQVAAQD